MNGDFIRILIACFQLHTSAQVAQNRFDQPMRERYPGGGVLWRDAIHAGEQLGANAGFKDVDAVGVRTDHQFRAQ